MKNQFKNKMIQMMLFSTMMLPASPLLDQTEMQWEIKEEKQMVDVLSLKIEDGKNNNNWVYETTDKTGKIVKKTIPADQVKVFTGKENKLTIIEETFLGQAPGDKMFFEKQKRYEFVVKEEMLAVQAAETTELEEEE